MLEYDAENQDVKFGVMNDGPYIENSLISNSISYEELYDDFSKYVKYYVLNTSDKLPKYNYMFYEFGLMQSFDRNRVKLDLLFT